MIPRSLVSKPLLAVATLTIALKGAVRLQRLRLVHLSPGITVGIQETQEAQKKTKEIKIQEDTQAQPVTVPPAVGREY
jgi:hypothetical protein